MDCRGEGHRPPGCQVDLTCGIMLAKEESTMVEVQRERPIAGAGLPLPSC